MVRMLMNHVTSFCGLSGEAWWKSLYFWTFYLLCFFFFKAGYFNKTTGGNTRQYCWNKTRQLLVPYVSWGLVSSVIYFTMLHIAAIRYHHFIETISWDHLWTTSGTFGNAPLWFLMSFFVTYIGMHFLGKLKHLHWIVLLFPFVSYGLYRLDNPFWLSLNNVFMCIYVFQLGNYWHKIMDKLSRPSAFMLSIFLVAIFCVVNIVFHGDYVVFSNTWTGNPVAIVVSLTCVLCGLSGVLLSIGLPRIPIINYVGQHSMVYFVAHYPIIIIYRFVRISFGHTIRGHWDDWILLMIIVPIVCSWMVSHVETIPWLSGRFPRRSETSAR